MDIISPYKRENVYIYTNRYGAWNIPVRGARSKAITKASIYLPEGVSLLRFPTLLPTHVSHAAPNPNSSNPPLAHCSRE